MILIFFLPFSYVYHFLPSLFHPPSTPSISLKFTGTLLERQKNIRNEVFSILNETKSIVLCLHYKYEVVPDFVTKETLGKYVRI